ncbi:MAG: UDP-N-acetylmuramoyl-L-alanine--D-glutamate ligase [Thermoflexales bacterium]|nr:UDP-N-acetylmuramoyl-L-alanine--D-glutamate ligase [Thermoflexales bacterium]
MGDRRVLILGLARQGMAAARYLTGQGDSVTVSDAKAAEVLGQALHALEDVPGLRYALGGHPLELLDECDLVCLSGGVPADLPIVVEARRRGVPITNDAQLFLESCPATVIGITGSAGKTTTTAMTGEMLRSSGRTTWVGGNIGNPLIADLEQIGADDVVVIELSSFQLEVMTRSPHIAAVLNITPNHLDRHQTMESYMAAKKRLVDFQAAGDVSVLGYDDPQVRRLIGAARGQVRLFSAHEAGTAAGFVRAGQLILRPMGEGAGLGEGGEIELCAVQALKLRGAHNILNVLAASLLAQAGGASTEAITRTATSFTGVAHRLQLVDEFNGVRYYDDSIATTPERLVAALQSFDEPFDTPGVPIVLLCGGRDKHLPWQAAALQIARRVSHLVLFGEMAGLVGQAVEQALAEAWTPGVKTHIHPAGTLENAVEHAVHLARPGDVVLLSPGGTSFDAFKDFAERGDKFAEWVKQAVVKVT